jgi:hypothetical protein
VRLDDQQLADHRLLIEEAQQRGQASPDPLPPTVLRFTRGEHTLSRVSPFSVKVHEFGAPLPGWIPVFVISPIRSKRLSSFESTHA